MMAAKTWLWKVFVTLVITVLSFSAVAGDDSLFLTPLLDNGDIQTARAQSEVKLSKFPELYSHAGYITVDKKLKNHLFFWHFPSQQNIDAPLLMWLNGGPSISSMLGLFWKHGPLEANRKKYGETYGRRTHTWVGPASVVYVDNPVGTGYSFSEMGDAGYKVTQAEYTHDLYNFVLQFFKMFPEYKSRQFYISGQSYAGKYVPALAHKIHTLRLNETSEIPLTGIILGGPYFDPPTMSVAFSDYLYALGEISHADMITLKSRSRSMYQKFLLGGFTNSTFDDGFRQIILIVGLSLDNYVTGTRADYELVENIMKSDEIREAVHAGSNRLFKIFNSDVKQLFVQDLFVSTKPEMAVLMDNYKVLIYNGDYDAIVSSIMLEAALMSTNWSLQEQYNNTSRTPWRCPYTFKKVKGFYSQTGNFCRVVVHGAGHQTPHDMPKTSLEMITNFLQYGCIPENVRPVERCETTEEHIERIECSVPACKNHGPETKITFGSQIFCCLQFYYIFYIISYYLK